MKNLKYDKREEENMIFRGVDYFELLLLNYEQFNLEKYDYFSLKQLTQLLLTQFGYIPDSDSDCFNSDYSVACSIIEFAH